MDLVTVVELLILIVIVGGQVYFFRRTLIASRELSGLFPAMQPIALVYSAIQESGDQPEALSPIRVGALGEPSSGFQAILFSMNRYLEKTRGVPVNLPVLQDIVERVTESLEQATLSTVSLPLYIGLMGTFAGVIVGLLSFARGEAPTMEDADLRRFIQGVLVAMCGSLVGLGLFVTGKTLIARAQAGAAAQKRSFYTFLQTELLPVVGQDVSSALYNLQSNLHRFNEEFRSNLSSFGTALEQPARVLQQQKDFLEALQQSKLHTVLGGTAEMVSALQKAAPSLQEFVNATSGFVRDLQTTREISLKLGELLDRVVSFEQGLNALGDKLRSDSSLTDISVEWIRKQLDTIQSRGELITQYAGMQDTKLERYMDQKQAELEGLLSTVNQKIASVGQELARHVSEAVSGDQTAELLRNIAMLSTIADHMGEIDRGIKLLATRKEETTDTALLRQIHAALLEQNRSRFRIGALFSSRNARRSHDNDAQV